MRLPRHGGAPNAELSAFLKTVGPGPKTQAKPAASATNVAVDATAQFVKAEAETDPKSEIRSPPNRGPAAKPQAKGSGGKSPPKNKNLMLAGAGGGALLVLLGVWFIFRGPSGEEIARVQLPDGGSVTVQQAASAGVKPAAATPSSTVSFFVAGVTPTGAPSFMSPTTSPSALQKRWPLAASQPADIQWLVGLRAEVTLRTAMPSINSAVDQTIKSATEIPAGAATIVGVHFMGKAARVTDADLARLCGFVDLESLSFDNDGDRSGPPREITGQGWSKLASLKHLRSLKLEGCRQVTVLPDFMASLTALESLDLQYPDAAEWARAAAAAPALKRINAYRTQLGDDGLAHLEKRTSLQQIDLRDSRVTQAAVDRFAAAVPQCRITWGADKNPTVIEPRVPPPSAAAPVAAPPPGDYALELKGFEHTNVGAWVDVPSLMLSETGPLTLEARVLRLGHNEGYVLGTENVGIRLFGGQWAAVGSPAKTKTFPSEIRRWYHLAAVRTDGELRMYVDGKRTDAQPLPPRTGPQPVPKSKPLKIGGNSANLRLDEIRISKTARYDADFTPPTTPFASDADTLALYHCNDGAGDVLKNSSGNGHDGKITKPSWVLPDGSPIPQSAAPSAFYTRPGAEVVAPSAEGFVYLDDLKPAEWSGGVGQLRGHGLGYGENPITWHGKQPGHSLFTHAVNDATARLSYPLDGRYETFAADVGLQDTVAKIDAATPLTFRVVGDGRELWKSSPIQKRTDEGTFSVSVRGVKDLVLEIACPGSSTHAHAIWINPRLTPVPAGGSPGIKASPINLLPLVDVTQDKIKGSWELKNGELHTGTDTGPLMLEFPYQPPEEYDFTIEFTYTAGGEIHQFLARQGRGFSWALGAMGYRFSGFERIDGKVVHENPTKRDYRPQFNQRHVSRVEVRNDGLRAYLDGKLIGEWKGDYKQLDAEVDPRWPFWKRRDPSRLAIGTKETPTIFHKAEVVEVRGTGTFIRPPAPIAPPGAKTAGIAPPSAVFPFNAATALKHQEAWAKHLGVPVEFTNTVGMKFRLIPPGEFPMGLGPEFTDDELIRLTGVKGVPDIKNLLLARSAHPVRITRPFYMEVEEVTSGRYRDVVGQLRPEMEQDPNKVLMGWVAWPDAIAFCNRLSEREGKRPAYRIEGTQITPIDDADGYRLPTEAQWEYACRAGTNTLWYFGNEGSVDGRTFQNQAAAPNPFGLVGLYGGSNETCWDATDRKPYSDAMPSRRDDPRQDVGTFRIKRGGSNTDGGGASRQSVNSFARASSPGGPYGSESMNYSGFGRVVLPIAAATATPAPSEPRTSVSGPAANPSLTVGTLPEQTTNPPAALRWPLTASKPEDLVWLQGLKATLTLRASSAFGGGPTDVRVQPGEPLPGGAATIVGIDFGRDNFALMTDDVLKRTATLVDLESLWLGFASVTPAVTKDGLPQLAALANLRRLNLTRIGPRETDPAFLERFVNLEYLNLGSQAFPDWESHVARLPALAELRLDKMGAANLQRLGPLPRLTALGLSDYGDAEGSKRHEAAKQYAPLVPWCRITVFGQGNADARVVIEPTAPPPTVGSAVVSPPTPTSR